MAWTMSYCTLDRSPMFGLPETLEQQFRAAAAAGFSLVTPDIFSLQAHRDAHGSLSRLREVADECGLGVYDLSGVTISDDEATTRRDVAEFIDFSHQLGAKWVQSRMTVDNATSRAMYVESAGAIREAGLGFAFEYSSFVPLNTLRSAAAFVAEISTRVPGQCLIIDTWHFDRCGDTFDDLFSVDPSLIAYLQLDDALPAGDDERFDTLNRREIPGQGNLDLGGFVTACERHGLGDRVVSIELMSEVHRLRAVDDYVTDIFQATDTLLRDASGA